MTLQDFTMNVFTIIGMLTTIVVTLIALVWLTLFMVGLLIKTFKYRLEVSVDVAKEDIDKKAETKRERNRIKREKKDAQKMETLQLKLDNADRIYNLRKKELEKSLLAKENEVRVKYGYDKIEQPQDEALVEDKKTKETKDTEEK